MEMPVISFYADPARTTLNPDIFSTVAQKWATSVCGSGLTEKNGKKKLERNKISQLRKFYDEAFRLASYRHNGENFDNILPFIKMLNAKTAYALGRNLITDEFSKFMKDSIAQIQNSQSLDVFLSFFEAFMGFYKYEESKYKGNDAD